MLYKKRRAGLLRQAPPAVVPALFCRIILVLCLFSATPADAEYLAPGVELSALTDDGKSWMWGWAPHGDLVLISREISDSQEQLWVIDSDGSKPRSITPIGSPFYARWSWAGDRVACLFSNMDADESQGNAFVYDLITGRRADIAASLPRWRFVTSDGPMWSADDRFISYRTLLGDPYRRCVWIHDSRTGKHQQILPNYGHVREPRWSYQQAERLAIRVQANNNFYDIATVDADGRDLVLLTDIGGQSVEQEDVAWSPTGEWVAYLSDLEMTESEQNQGCKDVWIARPDGSEVRNITQASSPATEDRLVLWALSWSWDGRWLIGSGRRFDQQGNEIDTLFMIDPVEGGYRHLATSWPQQDGEFRDWQSYVWSWDSRHIAITSEIFQAHAWGDDPEYVEPRTDLRLYDVETGEFRNVIVFSDEQDRRRLGGSVSWSPDGRSLTLSIARILSAAEDIVYPDVYRIDLPGDWGVGGPDLDGPPVGRERARRLRAQLYRDVTAAEEAQAAETALADPPTTVEALDDAPAGDSTASGEGLAEPDSLEPAPIHARVVKPLHLTISEVTSSLPSRYEEYLSLNPTRNMILFSGPDAEYRAFLSDLSKIDTPAPHLLVDLLVVEMSDEANRELGLDWTIAEGRFAFMQPEGMAIRDLTPDDTLQGLSTYPGVGQGFYQGVGRLPREFFVRLSMLEADGDATILANPRNVAQSGVESSIQIRKTVNFFFTEGYDTAGRPIVKKSDATADTIGRITPTLLQDGRVHMLVDVSVGSFTFTPDQNLPELTTRQAETEVIVGQGETIVIGGLRQQEMITDIRRTPVLGSIPVLGLLFRKEERQVKHSVLTILITPQVMNGDNPVPRWPKLWESDRFQEPIMEDPGLGADEEPAISPEWSDWLGDEFRRLTPGNPSHQTPKGPLLLQDRDVDSDE